MKINSDTAWKILKQRCSKKIVEHCEAVLNLALKLSKIFKVELDIEKIIIGSILHDIGRCKTHGPKHGFLGAKIAKNLNLDEDIIKIIERHVGGGIPKEEAKNLGLPNKDFIPKSNEEKLVSYADKCISHTKIIPIEKTIDRFSKKHGSDHSATKLLVKLKEDVEKNILKS